MAYLQKDRSVLKHRGHYTVHAGDSRYGRILASISKVRGRNSWWQVRSLNPVTRAIEDDLALPTFVQARDYALRQAGIVEN